VPREAYNLSEVRFGDVAVLKQFLVLHRKNSWKFPVYLLDLRFLVHMIQVISKLSLVEHFLIWATENPLKIRPLSAVLFWQISANIWVCHFIAFFLSSFDHGTFGEVATVVYVLYVVVLSWNLKQKWLIQCYAYTNVANRFVFSFVWRKFSSTTRNVLTSDPQNSSLNRHNGWSVMILWWKNHRKKGASLMTERDDPTEIVITIYDDIGPS
jgi:hypothetical protein